MARANILQLLGINCGNVVVAYRWEQSQSHFARYAGELISEYFLISMFLSSDAESKVSNKVQLILLSP